MFSFPCGLERGGVRVPGPLRNRFVGACSLFCACRDIGRAGVHGVVVPTGGPGGSTASAAHIAGADAAFPRRPRAVLRSDGWARTCCLRCLPAGLACSGTFIRTQGPVQACPCPLPLADVQCQLPTDPSCGFTLLAAAAWRLCRARCTALSRHFASEPAACRGLSVQRYAHCACAPRLLG